MCELKNHELKLACHPYSLQLRTDQISLRNEGGDEAVHSLFSIVIPVPWIIPVEVKIRLLSRIIRLVLTSQSSQ